NIAGANGIVPLNAAINVASASEQGTIVTMQFATAHGFNPGDIFFVAGVGVPYDGLFAVASVPSATSITYVAVAGGAPVGAAGTARSTQVVVTTTTPHGLINGDKVKITGNSQAIYNNTSPSGDITWTLNGPLTATTFSFTANANPLVGINGTVAIGGQITAGPHSAVQMFLTREGYITKPS